MLGVTGDAHAHPDVDAVGTDLDVDVEQGGGGEVVGDEIAVWLLHEVIRIVPPGIVLGGGF